MEIECNICAENFNKSDKKKINCPYCDHSSCLKCIKTYFLGLVDDYHCMTCRKKWSYQVIYELLPRSFIGKDLKEHRKKILLDREKSLLPETQTIIERENELNKLREERKNIKKQLNELDDRIRNFRFSETETERKQFVMKCPVDDCKGFLSTKWKCGICKTRVCKNCREIKEEDHECDEEILQSIELLKKDSKNCPNCAASIFRVEGCSQMWCTLCHIAFNWNTGKIINGNIHNPHYYDYLNSIGQMNNNRNMVVRCGVEWENSSVLNSMLMKAQVNESKIIKILEFHRNILHIQGIVLPRYNVNIYQVNSDIRKKYIKNDIDDDKFCRLLKTRETVREKKQIIYDILNMYIQACGDIFDLMLKEEKVPYSTSVDPYLNDKDKSSFKAKNSKRIEKLYRQLIRLKNYTEEELEKIEYIFKCSVPTLK